MTPPTDLPSRKSPRLKELNYSSAGAYFITVCTQNRKNTLSVIPNINVPQFSVGEGFPLPQLTLTGAITEKWIQNISEKYPQITVDCYTVMPNHFHLLLSVAEHSGRGDPSPTVETVIGWLKYQITKEVNRRAGESGRKVFQRSFYDHVVRNETDYLEITRYILENPLRWHFDKLYTEE